MAYNRNQVRAFLTKAESDLFDASLVDSSRELTSAGLKARVGRARTMRDKQRDLLQRQKLATQARTGSKLGRSGHANERTAQKLKAFEEALSRFEKEAARREPPAAKKTKALPAAKTLRRALETKKASAANTAPGARPLLSDKAPAVAPQSSAGPRKKSQPGAKAAAVASRLADANLSHIQGHTSTQVRRSQAKRDHRG